MFDEEKLNFNKPHITTEELLELAPTPELLKDFCNNMGFRYTKATTHASIAKRLTIQTLLEYVILEFEHDFRIEYNLESSVFKIDVRIDYSDNCPENEKWTDGYTFTELIDNLWHVFTFFTTKPLGHISWKSFQPVFD